MTKALTPSERLKTFARANADGFASVAMGLVYVLVMVLFNQRRLYYEVDRDEGFNLIKALLVDRGHPLYVETWSDQPPGYTYLLVAFTRLFGETPETARLLTLLLTGALVAAVYELARNGARGAAGHVAGVGAALALVLSTGFVQASTAVMIGLPAVAFAVFAWLAVSRARQRARWLVAAGALFACSLAVKLFTLPLVAVFALALLVDPPADGVAARPVLRRFAFFSAGFAAVLLLVFGPILFSGAADSLYASHVGARSHMGSRNTLLGLLHADWPLYAGAVLGTALGLSRRNLTALFALAWLLLGTLSLAVHTPLWGHHRFLISVPASVGFGILVGELSSLAGRAGVRRLRVAAIVAAVLASCAVGISVAERFDKLAANFRAKSARGALAVEKAVRRHAPDARMMIASRQMYAYRLGLEVPPALSVTSAKRFGSRELSASALREIVKKADADVIVLDSRWPSSARRAIERDLSGKYRRVHADPRNLGVKVFVRGESAEPGAKPGPSKSKRRKKSRKRG